MADKPKKHPIDAIFMRKLGEAIKSTLPAGTGMILLTFNVDETVPGSQANYLSTANREDCIKLLRETADRLDQGRDFSTPTNN